MNSIDRHLRARYTEGIDSERVKEICAAEREGRLTVVSRNKDTRKCRVCGCTDDMACPGGCFWIEPNLCSACATPEQIKTVLDGDPVTEE
jgi:hypothetical protein